MSRPSLCGRFIIEMENVMSSSQKLTLLNNVNIVGAGSAMQWDGGPAVVTAWWDGGVFAAGVHLEFSFDGGTHWAQCQINGLIKTNNNGRSSLGALELPSCMVRAVVDGATNPTNMNVVMTGYDGALNVAGAN
jgi:hypothetical protein